MEPFPEEDVLEATEVHALILIDLQPFRALLVFLELLLPLFLPMGGKTLCGSHLTIESPLLVRRV